MHKINVLVLGGDNYPKKIDIDPEQIRNIIPMKYKFIAKTLCSIYLKDGTKYKCLEGPEEVEAKIAEVKK